MDELRRGNMTENTLFIFMSDNGGPVGPVGSTNLPFRGGKLTSFEGGVRVPVVLHWPGFDSHFPPMEIHPSSGGRVWNYPLHMTDFFPTFLTLSGMACNGRSIFAPDKNGFDLFSVLLSPYPPIPRTLITDVSSYSGSMIHEHWKLVFNNKACEIFDPITMMNKPRSPDFHRELGLLPEKQIVTYLPYWIELYDLRNDPKEKHNLLPGTLFTPQLIGEKEDEKILFSFPLSVANDSISVDYLREMNRLWRSKMNSAAEYLFLQHKWGKSPLLHCFCSSHYQAMNLNWEPAGPLFPQRSEAVF